MVAISFSISFLLPIVTIFAGHYFPWHKLLGRDLSRIEAYIYGVGTIIGSIIAALMVLQVAGLLLQPWIAALLVIVSAASAGVATIGCHMLDNALETKHKLIDTEEQLHARR